MGPVAVLNLIPTTSPFASSNISVIENEPLELF